MRASETFYAALWADFLNNQQKSWITKFYRQKRRENGKDFSKSSPAELLALLAKPARDLSIPKEYQDWVLKLGGEALREAIAAERPRGVRAKFRLLQDLCEKNPELISGKGLDRLRILVLRAAAEKEAWDFFYDIGYRKPGEPEAEEKGTSEMGEGVERYVSETVANRAFEKPREKPRRKDNAFTMFDAWCASTSHVVTAAHAAHAAAGLTDEARRDWNRMYTILQRRPAPASVILPVMIDPATGIGLYLVGLQNFGNKKFQRDLAAMIAGKVRQDARVAPSCNCVFLCMGPTDFWGEIEGYKGEELEERMREESYISCAPIGDTICCVTLEDGERQFKNLVSNDSSAYSFFRGYNRCVPEGTPKSLHIFFEKEGPKKKISYKKLEEEGKAVFVYDLG